MSGCFGLHSKSLNEGFQFFNDSDVLDVMYDSDAYIALPTDPRGGLHGPGDSVNNDDDGSPREEQDGSDIV